MIVSAIVRFGFGAFGGLLVLQALFDAPIALWGGAWALAALVLFGGLMGAVIVRTSFDRRLGASEATMTVLGHVGLLSLVTMAVSFYVNGRVEGVVQGPSDEPLPGATVLLAGPHGIQRVLTDAEGRFEFKLRPREPEAYKLLVCAPAHLALSSDVPRNYFGTASYGLGLRQGFESVVDWRGPVPPECGPMRVASGSR